MLARRRAVSAALGVGRGVTATAAGAVGADAEAARQAAAAVAGARLLLYRPPAWGLRLAAEEDDEGGDGAVADADAALEEVTGSMEVLLDNGELVYVACIKPETEAVAARRSATSAVVASAAGSLLPVPIAVLKSQAAAAAAANVRTMMDRATALMASARGGVGEDDEGDGDGGGGDGDEEDDAAVALRRHAASDGTEDAHGAPALWVDKYAPRAFADLLSSEVVNRNVLKWIKLWDARVFGGAKGSGGGGGAGSKRTHAAVGGMFGGGGGGAAGAGVETGAAKRAKVAGEGGTGAAAAAAGLAAVAGQVGDTPAAHRFAYGWRPDARALLLCGPPGMGKTTLAHIAARQAGYRAVEINASDDRSAKTIQERIADAQGMRSVFGERRPALVILDEIDGMEGGATGGIAELVKKLKATPSPLPRRTGGSLHAALAVGGGGGGGKGGDGEGGGDEDDDAMARETAAGGKRGAAARGKGGRGGGEEGGDDGDGDKRDTVTPLTRPLICICNDQYAPALRDLRPLVQVVEFGRTAGERLVARLRAVCAAEGLSVTQDALQTLASLTDNDIRSCLNTLQFIKYRQGGGGGGRRRRGQGDALRSGPRVTAEDIARAAVGVKDQTKALYDVWAGVFRKPDLRLRSAAALASLGLSASNTGGLTAASRVGVLARGGVIGGGSGVSAAAGAAKQYWGDLASQLGAYNAETRLLLAGLEENLTASRAADPTLSHTARALDWLCWGEEVGARVGVNPAAGALLKYVSVAGLGVHAELACDLAVKIAWPRGDAASRATLDARRNICQTFLTGRAGAAAACGMPVAAGALDARTAVLDLLSPLLTILSPALRPVNFGLFNTREKRDAQDLVQVRLGTHAGW